MEGLDSFCINVFCTKIYSSNYIMLIVSRKRTVQLRSLSVFLSKACTNCVKYVLKSKDSATAQRPVTSFTVAVTRM